MLPKVQAAGYSLTCMHPMCVALNWCRVVWCTQNVCWDGSSFMRHLSCNNQAMLMHCTKLVTDSELHCMTWARGVAQKQKTAPHICHCKAQTAHLRWSVRQIAIYTKIKKDIRSKWSWYTKQEYVTNSNSHHSLSLLNIYSKTFMIKMQTFHSLKQ